MTESSGSLLTCTICLNILDEYEAEHPYTVPDEEALLCDECYHAWYEFRCSWCDGWGEKTDQRRYIAIFNAAAVGLPLGGLYCTKGPPYYKQPILFPYFAPDTVTWLGRLPAEIGSNRPAVERFPYGHLCAACQKRALAHILYLTRCGVAALSTTPP